jgi:hypothetical protein
MEKLPGADPFIKPWMIDRANDHYALDIKRARTLLGGRRCAAFEWSPRSWLPRFLPRKRSGIDIRLGSKRPQEGKSHEA